MRAILTVFCLRAAKIAASGSMPMRSSVNSRSSGKEGRPLSVHWNMFDVDVLQWTLSGRPSLPLLREFTELRIGIEPEAAILAARKQNTVNIARIHDALGRMEAAERGQDDALEADIAFHTALLVASEHRFFIQLCNFIETELRVSIACTNQIKGVGVASEADHRAVYRAIVEGDQLGAHNAMLSLLTEALRSEEHTSELQSRGHIVSRLLLE